MSVVNREPGNSGNRPPTRPTHVRKDAFDYRIKTDDYETIFFSINCLSNVISRKIKKSLMIPTRRTLKSSALNGRHFGRVPRSRPRKHGRDYVFRLFFFFFYIYN